MKLVGRSHFQRYLVKKYKDMWNSKIAAKEFDNGSVKVNVNYSNGSHDFNELYWVTDQSDLDNRVINRKKNLSKVITLLDEIVVGDFNPTEKQPIIDESRQALDALNIGFDQLQKKLITDEDYQDLVTAYKEAEK